MGKLQFSANQILGIAAGCSILAAILCNTALIPYSHSVEVSYRESSQSSAAEPLSSSAAALSPSPERSASTLLVDINRASQAELETLPGIGPALAERIIDFREQNGAFLSPEDLTKVKGIGDKTLEELLPYITCG